ncbi:MAG TPA: hypothetical protein VK978_03595 [Candidatus Saccharimonadales bacterium]|nr:hypothetical protein [Candidatus Saccharimonadales bacterium]
MSMETNPRPTTVPKKAWFDLVNTDAFEQPTRRQRAERLQVLVPYVAEQAVTASVETAEQCEHKLIGALGAQALTGGEVAVRGAGNFIEDYLGSGVIAALGARYEPQRLAAPLN